MSRFNFKLDFIDLINFWDLIINRKWASWNLSLHYIIFYLSKNINKNWSIKVNVLDSNFKPNTLNFFNSFLLIFWKEEVYAYYIHGVIFELQTPLNLAELIKYISILYNYMYELKFELYTPKFFSVRMEINYLVHWHVASDFSTKS
jgi:hypothetical protein